MYYDEKIIDGILCYRTMPKGSWIPCSSVAMTEMLVKERARARAAGKALAYLLNACETAAFQIQHGAGDYALATLREAVKKTRPFAHDTTTTETAR